MPEQKPTIQTNRTRPADEAETKYEWFSDPEHKGDGLHRVALIDGDLFCEEYCEGVGGCTWIAATSGECAREILRLAAALEAELQDRCDRLLEIYKEVGETLPNEIANRSPVDALRWFKSENAKLRERVGKLEVFLLSIEWQLDPEDGGEYCPACKMNKRAGHRDCLLAALLTEER